MRFSLVKIRFKKKVHKSFFELPHVTKYWKWKKPPFIPHMTNNHQIGTVWGCQVQFILIEVNFLSFYIEITKILATPQWMSCMPLVWAHSTLEICSLSNRTCSDEMVITNPMFSNDWSRFIYQWQVERVQLTSKEIRRAECSWTFESVACLYQDRTYIFWMPPTNTF